MRVLEGSGRLTIGSCGFRASAESAFIGLRTAWRRPADPRSWFAAEHPRLDQSHHRQAELVDVVRCVSTEPSVPSTNGIGTTIAPT